MDTIVYDSIGTLFKNYFDTDNYYYESTIKQHDLQALTESDKKDVAYRVGLYLTHVTEVEKKPTDENKSETKSETKSNTELPPKPLTGTYFHLLRCSSNFQGPTEGFTEKDLHIINKVNKTAKELYGDCAELNHVLAQLYVNHTINNRVKRAKIPAHSDKTEDMPKNGVMVFCTFYDPNALRNKKYHMVDGKLMYKNALALTTLRFVNKLTNEKTDVILYPNSALFIDLTTNEKYTHEIIPPGLNPEDIPTRLGYVVRCSDQKALFMKGDTFLVLEEDNKKQITQYAVQYAHDKPIKNPFNDKESIIKLRHPTQDDVNTLKELYRIENTSTTRPDYGLINYTLNKGDFLKPKKL